MSSIIKVTVILSSYIIYHLNDVTLVLHGFIV